ncbi:MAG TPA: four helix bundle protein [Nitrospiraceae bacterium]|jgi:uroporphyrinogen-III synthase
MADSQQTEQLRTKAKQFAIGILKLFGSLPKTPETHAIEAPLVKAATTLAADCRGLARAWSEDDFLSRRGVAASDADDCVFWLELLSAAAGSDHDQQIHALLEDVSELVALLSICNEQDQPAPSTSSAEVESPPVASESSPPPLPTDFHGLRILSFESRMADEMSRLIEKSGGVPVVVPALREIPIPLQDNGAVFRFGVRLMLEQVDILILLTGTGTKALFEVLQTRYSLADIAGALKKVLVVARGPKPRAALKALGLEPNITVPEPNTWVEVVSTLDEYRPVKGFRVAVQEYGMSNPDLLEALKQRGADVFPIPIYRWALPEELGLLRQVIGEMVDGRIDAMLITNAAQLDHVMQLVERENKTDLFKEACKKVVVASIGPTASERLRHYDLPIDFEPSHSKMGVLVKEVSQRVHALLQVKRP